MSGLCVLCVGVGIEEVVLVIVVGALGCVLSGGAVRRWRIMAG